MSKVHGRDLTVLVETDGEWKAVACATTCELDVDVSLLATGSGHDGAWKHSIPKLKGWRVTAGHLLSSAEQPVDFGHLIQTAPRVRLAFVTVEPHYDAQPDNPEYTPDGVMVRTGHAIVTRQTVTAGNRDFVTMSVEFTGDGPLLYSFGDE